MYNFPILRYTFHVLPFHCIVLQGLHFTFFASLGGTVCLIFSYTLFYENYYRNVLRIFCQNISVYIQIREIILASYMWIYYWPRFHYPYMPLTL